VNDPAIMVVVPGIIEDTDPGEPSGRFQSFVTYSTQPPAPPSQVDLELQADRLRFMGLDEGLVAEFLRRAAADHADAHRWLGDQIEAMAPPEPPPTCDCGEVLVGLDWRGAAIMRCSKCAARWRVEISIGDTWSQSAIDGPSAEWLAAHPVEYDDPYGDLAPEQVIEDGLPPLVEMIEPGRCFPVASWTGPRYAAVLYVCRHQPGEYDFPGDEYENEIEHLIRADDGWLSTGSGGGGWVNALDPPRDLLDKYVALGTGTSGFSDDHDAIFFTGGLCSTAVASVETSDLDGVRRIELDAARPFFLTGIRGQGRIRILGRDGEVLRSWTGDALEWDVGDDPW
jgi:hypothetical protein